MFYYLSQLILDETAGTALGDALSGLRVFRYITVRSAGAALTGLALSLWLGPAVIAWLKRMRFGCEYVDRADVGSTTAGDTTYKQKVPVMGGLLLVVAIDLSTLLWAQWTPFTILTLCSLVGLAGLGFYDDYAKITQQSSRGVRSTVKLLVQTALALFIALYLLHLPATRSLVTDIMVPFYKHPVLTGVAGVGLLLAVGAIVGSSNAVNLTDGLDGLAIGCTLIVTGVFLVLTYVAGNVKLATYLQVPYVAGAGELTVICAAMIGASLGFLWYNCYPAQVFMGDTGSLALGGTLGIMAVLVHQPLVLLIAGGVFVWEAGSVMVQVSWFKYTRRRTGVGRRVFRKTPIHHHFRELGWPESKVVTRFHILCVLCAVIALASLKLR